FFCSPLPPPPHSTLFPYTTLYRSKRELERLKRIARNEGVYTDQRFRDEIAKLEVDVVALDMLVLRVLSAEKSGKNPLDIAGLLKDRKSTSLNTSHVAISYAVLRLK